MPSYAFLIVVRSEKVIKWNDCWIKSGWKNLRDISLNHLYALMGRSLLWRPKKIWGVYPIYIISLSLSLCNPIRENWIKANFFIIFFWFQQDVFLWVILSYQRQLVGSFICLFNKQAYHFLARTQINIVVS